MGSLLTYLRRYGLSALAGVASEDDDDGQLAQPGPAAARVSRTRGRRGRSRRARRRTSRPGGSAAADRRAA
jgi:hypothetical protein